MKKTMMWKMVILIGCVTLLSSCVVYDGKIIDGYYIDFHKPVKFKIPSDSRVLNDWTQISRRTNPKKQIDVGWKKSSNTYSQFLCKIFYERLEIGNDNIISSEIETEVHNWSTGPFKNVKIIKKDTLQKTQYDSEGILVISFDYNGSSWFKVTREILEVRFVIKNDFLISVQYRNFEDKFNRKAVDKMIDNIFESFETNVN